MDSHEHTPSNANAGETSAAPAPPSLARRSFLKAALASAPMLVVGPSLLTPPTVRAQNIGPSTTKDAYLLPSIPGVETFSILTVGDSVGRYRMVGIPDGLGAFRSGRDQFTLLMNHEITAAAPASCARMEAMGRSSRAGRSIGRRSKF